MKLKNRNQRGQALVMVTLALIAMCGMLGLAVDLGWSYFIKKSAQAASDSASLAAAEAALAGIGQSGPFTCSPPNLVCQATTPCPSSLPSSPASNIDNGCIYAGQNGFVVNGNSQRQMVTMTANVSPPTPPTAPGVVADYWVTARVSESIPQLFSAVLGNNAGLSSARSTAAILDSVVPGSLYLLNRENDPGPTGTGVDVFVQGGGIVDAQGGVFMASSADGSVGEYAGHAGGNATVDGGDVIFIRESGAVDNPGNFLPPPESKPDLPMYFWDPMRGKGQPPAPPTLPEIGIPGGTIHGDCGSPRILTPGAYYATDPNNPTVGTGRPLSITGCVSFSTTGGFGDYVFFGGASFPSTQTVVTFAPGRYVFAGALPNNPIFYMHNGVRLEDQTPLANGQPVPNTDAGEILIFTDTSYPGLQPPPSAIPPRVLQNMRFGEVDIQMGNTDRSMVNLHGLNRQSIDLPSDLKTFSPTVFWQDQRNSSILYKPDGNIDTSCNNGSLNSPCLNTDPRIDPLMDMQAHPNLHLWGVVYQPRGSVMNFQGHGTMNSPMQLITGTLRLQGSPNVTLQPLPHPLTRKVVALVE